MNNFKRTKRVLAWIGIIILSGLYLATLILALIGSSMAQALFRGAFAATVLFPVLLYAFQLIYRLLKQNDDPSVPEKKDGKS